MSLQLDALFIVGISLFTAFLGEGLTYLLVYRTEQYKKLKLEIEKQTKKLEKVTSLKRKKKHVDILKIL